MNNYILGIGQLHRNILMKDTSWSLELTHRQKANFINTFLLYIPNEQYILTCGPWMTMTYCEHILQKKWEIC